MHSPKRMFGTGYIDSGNRCKEGSNLPKLSSQLWSLILARTDLQTCLDLEFYAAARETVKNRHQALEKALAAGHLRCLEFLLTNYFPTGPTDAHVDTAIQFGHYPVLCWLQNRGFRCFNGAPAAALCYDQIEVLDWLYENCPESLGVGLVPVAARTGSWRGMQWLVENGVAPNQILADGEIMCCAASGGHLRMVEWLLEKHHVRPIGAAYASAAKNGHLHVVQYLHGHCNQRWPCLSRMLNLILNGIPSEDVLNVWEPPLKDKTDCKLAEHLLSVFQGECNQRVTDWLEDIDARAMVDMAEADSAMEAS